MKSSHVHYLGYLEKCVSRTTDHLWDVDNISTYSILKNALQDVSWHNVKESHSAA